MVMFYSILRRLAIQHLPVFQHWVNVERANVVDLSDLIGKTAVFIAAHMNLANALALGHFR